MFAGSWVLALRECGFPPKGTGEPQPSLGQGRDMIRHGAPQEGQAGRAARRRGEELRAEILPKGAQENPFWPLFLSSFHWSGVEVRAQRALLCPAGCRGSWRLQPPISGHESS